MILVATQFSLSLFYVGGRAFVKLGSVSMAHITQVMLAPDESSALLLTETTGSDAPYYTVNSFPLPNYFAPSPSVPADSVELFGFSNSLWLDSRSILLQNSCGHFQLMELTANLQFKRGRDLFPLPDPSAKPYDVYAVSPLDYLNDLFVLVYRERCSGWACEPHTAQLVVFKKTGCVASQSIFLDFPLQCIRLLQMTDTTGVRVGLFGYSQKLPGNGREQRHPALADNRQPRFANKQEVWITCGPPDCCVVFCSQSVQTFNLDCLKIVSMIGKNCPVLSDFDLRPGINNNLWLFTHDSFGFVDPASNNFNTFLLSGPIRRMNSRQATNGYPNLPALERAPSMKVRFMQEEQCTPNFSAACGAISTKIFQSCTGKFVAVTESWLSKTCRVMTLGDKFEADFNRSSPPPQQFTETPQQQQQPQSQSQSHALPFEPRVEQQHQHLGLLPFMHIAPLAERTDDFNGCSMGLLGRPALHNNQHPLQRAPQEAGPEGGCFAFSSPEEEDGSDNNRRRQLPA